MAWDVMEYVVVCICVSVLLKHTGINHFELNELKLLSKHTHT